MARVRFVARRATRLVAFVAALGVGLLVPSARVETAGAAAGLTASDFWLVPAAAGPGRSSLATAADELSAGKFTLALSALAQPIGNPGLRGYALLYQGRAQLSAGRAADAASTAQRLLSANPTGHLGDAALELAADAAEISANWTAVVRHLQTLTLGKPFGPERVYLRLGRAAENARDLPLAIRALTTVYYDFALTPEADLAAADLARLAPRGPANADSYPRDLGRAQQLYEAKRFTDARKAFVAVREFAPAGDRPTVDLRLAECDFGLRRYAVALEGLRPYLGSASPSPREAEYFSFSAHRELGHQDEYLRRGRAFIQAQPADAWTEEALYDLGTYFTRQDDDAHAAAAFAELSDRFPAGTRSEKAAWKFGWWSFKSGAFADAARVFETAAVTFRHSDYRPSWLYWAARSHQRQGDVELARAGFRQVVSDYRNSYYGREAARSLGPAENAAAAGTSITLARFDTPSGVAAIAPPVTAPIIRSLLSAGLYDDAVSELRRTERESGVTPLLEATIAFAQNRRGELRPAITTMRRAYPQFLASGGEALPVDLLAVIFPVQYWDVIRKYAALHKLDPCLVAALINQESTFDAGIRSSADAWGLMQIVPSTGRQYARSLGIPAFRTSKLTDPETNVRIGTAYLAELIQQYGDAAVALAAYNAGGSRAARWVAERPGVDRDEFIDDIPFPETQNYVKRVLGAVEDYRLLYETGKATPLVARSGKR